MSLVYVWICHWINCSSEKLSFQSPRNIFKYQNPDLCEYKYACSTLMHDLRTRGFLESSWTKLCSGGNVPIEPTCLKIEQTLLAFQISACVSIEKLINPCQLGEIMLICCILNMFLSLLPKVVVSSVCLILLPFHLICVLLLNKYWSIHLSFIKHLICENLYRKTEWLYRKTYKSKRIP